MKHTETSLRTKIHRAFLVALGSPTLTPGLALGTSRAVWQITEVFEFLARMGRYGFYPSGAIVSICLKNTQGRNLWVDDPQRMPFLDQKKPARSKSKSNEKFQR
jgi:hypothetical protein